MCGFVLRALAAAVVLATAASGTCIHRTTLSPRQVDGAVEVSTFGYTGTTGPHNWASLDAANIQCSVGRNQSPINIDESVGTLAETPQIDIPSVEAAKSGNLGTTVEVVVNGTMSVLGGSFSLKQFQFHSPGEHRINEEYFPLEMHMVHETVNGNTAVIAVLFDLSTNATTALLRSVMQKVSEISTPGTVTETGPLNFSPLIRHLSTTPLHQYSGSLTTPPCAEGLTFLVTQQPLPIDAATFNAAKRVIKFNSRYTQNTSREQNILGVAFDTVQRASGGFSGPGGSCVDGLGHGFTNRNSERIFTRSCCDSSTGRVHRNVGNWFWGAGGNHDGSRRRGESGSDGNFGGSVHFGGLPSYQF